MGRKKPYTAKGIKRVPCFRCGNQSVQQWQICSLDNEYKAVCRECDIKLNRLVLKFMRIGAKKVYYLIEKYKKRFDNA